MKMSDQIMAGSPSIHKTNTVPDVNRRSANYHPSIWGDHILLCASKSMEKLADIEINKVIELKEEVKRMIVTSEDVPSKKLDLIDKIQRLGVSYHFKNEIETVLKEIFNGLHNCPYNEENNENELYIVALRFRLLRQQGYHVSCDIFKKFKNNKGKFKETLVSDIRGMLSLYEATFLRVHDEDILDEALDFTTTYLNSAVLQNVSPADTTLMGQVTHALKQPIRKGLTRVEARHYMSLCQQDPSYNKILLKFAKLDFKLVQKLHLEELAHIARWWKELDFARKLPFARDRITECFFWTLGVYFEPQYCFARRTLTKVIAMTSIIDDIYDVYGTLEELELFTEAAERWDISAIDELPEYMKICYKALLDVYTEIEETLATEDGKLYQLGYAKEAIKCQIRAYFQEAKWFHLKYVPTMEEYMPLALETSGYVMLATTSFVGMGDIVTTDSFEWLSSNPKMVRASTVVCRLMDDIVSHKFEQKRGHVASAVECYIKQYEVTEDEAVKDLRNQVIDAWKDINEECLYPVSVPMPLLKRILNLARVMDVLYKDEDGYTHSSAATKDMIASILIDPVLE